jgi:large subunit ribosomal protein L18
MNNLKLEQKKSRIRTKIRSLSSRLRLSVFRSNKFIYAQIIDDTKGITLVSAKGEDATAVGEALAKKAITKKIKEVVFDRGSYKFHGVVKSLAEGARKGGLSF